jgi:hypothetical protein
MTTAPPGTPDIPPPESAPGDLPPPTSRSAIASLVLGIIGFATAGIFGLAGLIVGIVALVGINASGGRRGGRGLAVAGIAVSVCSMLFSFVCVGLALPALAQARVAARNAVASSTMDLAGTATLVFMAEHDGALPPAGSWKTALEEGGTDVTSLLVAVEDLTGRSFAMNIHLDGLGEGDLAEPSTTVLFFETEPGGPLAGGRDLLPERPAYARGYLIVYANGVTDNVPGFVVDTLTWEP